MRSFIVPKLTRLFSGGLVAGAILAAGALRAGEDSTTSQTTQGSGGAKLQSADVATFIKNASQANSAEVTFAELAERKSQNADVKDFARMMKTDHRTANDNLRPIAQAHSVPMNESLDATHQKMLEQYHQLSGTAFDQQFMKDMLKGHQKVIAMFENAAQQVQAPDVKEYAQNTLPILRRHMTHAKQTAQAVGIDQQTISSILKESGGMGGTGDEYHKDSGTVRPPEGGTKPEQRGGPEQP